MDKKDFDFVYRRNNDKFPFGQHGNTSLKTHIKKIIDCEYVIHCRKFVNWTHSISLPKEWENSIKNRTFSDIIISLVENNNLNEIHKYKEFGLSNTHWDYSEYLKELELDNPELVKTYKHWYKNEDPIGRSLINFLNTNCNGIWEIISWNNKICEKNDKLVKYIIDFSTNLTKTTQSLVHLQNLLRKNAAIIFCQPTDISNNTLFSKISKEIIKTKSSGKEGVDLVENDLKQKNISYIITNSGDILDIVYGMDMILLSPINLIGKTTQIKNCKNIKQYDSDNLIIYCDGVKKYDVDFFSFCFNDKVRYFLNNYPTIDKDNNYYIISIKDEIFDLKNQF